MKCILLCAPGEILEGKSEWLALGYDAKCYPTTQDVSSLRDERDNEWTSFLGFRPEACDRPYVRSLRASFIRMLCDPAFAKDDFILFGESDATPVIGARALESSLRELLHQQPEIDVVRLFHELTYSPENLQGTKPLFEPYLTGPRTRSNPSVWGTHALVIPARSRQKIANLFAACRLPTDTCLEAAGSRGEIVMMVARDNWFYQKPRTCTFDQTTLYSYRQRKIAVCLSSFKRLHDAQRQILAFMHQSYPNFHLFVAVKGITEYVFRQILVPPCQSFINEGRLTLRLFPNKNPLSNLIDTVRNLNVADYELFAIIDDDAFYNPEYLTLINDFHTAAPQHHGSYYNDVGSVLGRRDGYVFLKQEALASYESSLVLTRKQWQLACLHEQETGCVPHLRSENSAGLDRSPCGPPAPCHHAAGGVQQPRSLEQHECRFLPNSRKRRRLSHPRDMRRPHW